MGLLSSKSRSTNFTESHATGAYGTEGQTVTGEGNLVFFSDDGAIQAAVDMNKTNAAYHGETLATVLGFASDLTDDSYSFAGSSQNEAFDFARSQSAISQQVYGDALNSVGKAYTGAVDAVKSAYNSATGSFDVQKTLFMGGLIIAGIVAIRTILK